VIQVLALLHLTDEVEFIERNKLTIKLKKKTVIFPRNQLKRVKFCREMAEYEPAFWDTVIWSDETTVRKCPQGKEMLYRASKSSRCA
jgi:hypothetical protein